MGEGITVYSEADMLLIEVQSRVIKVGFVFCIWLLTFTKKMISRGTRWKEISCKQLPISQILRLLRISPPPTLISYHPLPHNQHINATGIILLFTALGGEGIKGQT